MAIKAAQAALPQDPGKELMRLLVVELVRRLTDQPGEMVASELEVARKLLQDNSVTLAHVQRGDYGTFAKSVAEEFPFEHSQA